MSKPVTKTEFNLIRAIMGGPFSDAKLAGVMLAVETLAEEGVISRDSADTIANRAMEITKQYVPAAVLPKTETRIGWWLYLKPQAENQVENQVESMNV